MIVKIFNDYEELSRHTAEFVAGIVNRNPESLICFPSGDTPAGTFEQLVSMARSGEVDFSRCKFVGLDEWVGMNRFDEGGCANFIYASFFEPLGIKEEQICFFDGRAEDLNEECRKTDKFIAQNGPIDIMLVGIGMNGHIALNEPGISFELYSHVVQLDNTTKVVAQKYFDKQTALQKGITLGLKHMTNAKYAVLIANGTRKAQIIRQALEESPSSNLPASIVQLNSNSLVFLDKDAASALTKE